MIGFGSHIVTVGLENYRYQPLLLIFTRPKGGAIFAPPLRHIIKKLTAVGSHIDGSDHPQILFMRDPRGFK
jgi:hypothetical protein